MKEHIFFGFCCLPLGVWGCFRGLCSLPSRKYCCLLSMVRAGSCPSNKTLSLCMFWGVSELIITLSNCLLFDNALFLSHLLFGLRYSSTRLAGCWVVLRSSCWDGDLWENSYWLIYLPFRILYSPYGGLGLIPAEESGPLPPPCCVVCLPQVN